MIPLDFEQSNGTGDKATFQSLAVFVTKTPLTTNWSKKETKNTRYASLVEHVQ